MGEKLESAIIDAIVNANFKNIAGSTAYYAGLAMGDAGNVATGNEANALVKAGTAGEQTLQRISGKVCRKIQLQSRN
jgi:hypothetical protein